jgi:hypothetical protein
MGNSVNVSDRTKRLLEGIRDSYGYKSLDAAMRKAIDESNIDQDKMLEVTEEDTFDIDDFKGEYEFS